MSAIDDFRIEKVAGASRLRVSFDYTHVAQGFEHVLLLVPEQDSIGDDWSLRLRDHTVQTPAGPIQAKYLDFYNETYGKFWNVGGSAGAEDDTGNRRFLYALPKPLGQVRASYEVAYYAGQPDTAGTATIPGLEFYAVACIVAAVNGHAGAQLGEIAYSNQLAGA